MATVNSTVTVDTGEWLYVDVTGMTHTVTNGQTFQLRIDDNSSTDVRYYFAVNQTPITCTDGLSLTFRPYTAPASGTGGNEYRMIAPLTDAGEGSAAYGLRGGMRIECPVSGVVQDWIPAKINTSNADFNAAGTLIMTFEDQFGHSMTIPFTGSGLSVGQAA